MATDTRGIEFYQALSDTQEKVFTLLVRGHSNESMAKDLNYSVKFIGQLITSMYGKINWDVYPNANKRAMLVYIYWNNG
jgi:DNA-binding NarL/FixJ family response regulator